MKNSNRNSANISTQRGARISNEKAPGGWWAVGSRRVVGLPLGRREDSAFVLHAKFLREKSRKSGRKKAEPTEGPASTKNLKANHNVKCGRPLGPVGRRPYLHNSRNSLQKYGARAKYASPAAVLTFYSSASGHFAIAFSARSLKSCGSSLPSPFSLK